MQPTSTPPTLLVTGGTGYLGSRILELAQDWNLHATYCSTLPTDSSKISFHKCDLKNADNVDQLVSNLHPTVIIHTACSNHTPHDLDSIIPAATNLSQTADHYHTRVIHVSSDMVFDGHQAPYDEIDRPNPLTPYGTLKAQAEQIFTTQNLDSLIVRTSLIYGTNPLDHHSRWLLDGINNGDRIPLFTDETRCPIWVDTLAQALLELARLTERGVLHVAGPQMLTRWEFGQALLTLLRESRSSLLMPSTIKASGLVRPSDLSLNVQKAQRLLQTPLLTIKEVTTFLHSKD